LKILVKSQDGWEEVECRQYGQVVTKRVRSFIATSRVTKDNFNDKVPKGFFVTGGFESVECGLLFAPS